MSEENKSFTQEEVNSIVGERLKQERAKIMKEVQAKEAELTRRETMMNTRADWQKRGLPVELLEYLEVEKLDEAAAILEKGHLSSGSRGGFSGNVKPGDVKPGSFDAEIRKKMGLFKKE